MKGIWLQTQLVHWNIIRGVCQTFKDANEFKIMLMNYMITNLRSFIYKKNDSTMIIATCYDKNCNEEYNSRSQANKLFGIRKCNLDHTCLEANLQTRGHSKAGFKAR